MTENLAILGSWPPPAGGVSIHVRRLSPLLLGRGIGHVVYNATSDAGDGERVISVYRRRHSWLVRYLLTGREPAIYLLSGRLAAWVLAALLGKLRGKRMILRLRNDALLKWTGESWLKRHLCRFALRQMDGVVCVNQELARVARELGVAAGRVHWIPGFLPPGEADTARADVDERVWSFVDAHAPVIAANGKAVLKDGVDLYGLDHLVELTQRLQADYPDIGVVVCFWQHLAGEQEYLQELLARAERAGVAGNILFNTSPGPFVPVAAAAQVFIRPTSSDGDANSIREALHLGTPAIASDVVGRPRGTVLFRTRDIDDMERVVREVLESRTDTHLPAADPGDADAKRVEAYLNLLESLASGNAAGPHTFQQQLENREHHG